MTERRRTTTAFATAALSGLLCALAVAPAHAAGTPRGWEADALGLAAAQRDAQGEGVTVGLLDTGVVADHPAVKGKITTGPDFRKGTITPSSPEWGYHGTHMASDILKVAPKAKILSVRVNSEEDKRDDGSLAKTDGTPLAKGIVYAVDHGVDVISMSLGTGEVDDYADEDTALAVGYAVSHGVTLLGGAGNGGDKLNQPSAPGGLAGVIAVAATQRGGGRADFSTVHTYNEVAAPGVEIAGAKNTGGYERIQGTSPATALASGVVALMLSKNQKLTPAQVRSILTRTAHHPSGGWNAEVGYGQINAAAAVKRAASPPADKTAPIGHKGTEHFATPVGTPKTTHPNMEQGLWLTGLGAAGAGLLMLIGGVLVAVLGRRKAATAGMVGGGTWPSASGPLPR
ncbi:S8 family peptidase [Streptomyces sp. NBC_01304]|uniref:S8 family peptidase n=1 Tax=Streptomyces sp. NBC_01304 TaxID=2903818 RepID=UPI002E137B67|nr:S8 family serine peptidase [Streptomyces sp. NBC_01304]